MTDEERNHLDELRHGKLRDWFLDMLEEEDGKPSVKRFVFFLSFCLFAIVVVWGAIAPTVMTAGMVDTIKYVFMTSGGFVAGPQVVDAISDALSKGKSTKEQTC